MSVPALELSNLIVSRQGRLVLKGINFSLEKGSAAVLSGSNGCGKTTLLRCIAGLLPYDQGKIQIMGYDKSSVHWQKRRHSLAYVSQEQPHKAFPVTVMEMTATGLAGIKKSRSERERIIDSSLEACGCLDLKQRSYFTLSGGERQRVALARCLAQGADVLLLDEPMTYLDKEGRILFSTLLDHIRMSFGISILLVTHTQDDFTSEEWQRISLKDGVLELQE
ncbi:ATP-binding cassette domain-containing protein [Oceanispirochaeta crateris]|uniref:ATP-binding cassette domain-containing protein n=1 Tax=Oceanispirochaeta crateris TaxID=2518645 RepID=A0A5C1QGA6_9SPIO|nr:ATP-binding cassette domain-containing protein [Oceanispirochaeta crateris]QEN07105.1 ATP-binding cassette domain-containing protein [Oceanispirochaeta crateris]